MNIKKTLTIFTMGVVLILSTLQPVKAGYDAVILNSGSAVIIGNIITEDDLREIYDAMERAVLETNSVHLIFLPEFPVKLMSATYIRVMVDALVTTEGASFKCTGNTSLCEYVLTPLDY